MMETVHVAPEQAGQAHRKVQFSCTLHVGCYRKLIAHVT